jgi:UrcA family protein
MFKTAPALALAAVQLAIAQPAVAQSGSWRIADDQVRLYYADLDMGSATGRAELLSRVEKAADRLCRDVRIRERQRACVADTVRSAAIGPKGRMLARAMTERDGTALAAR